MKKILHNDAALIELLGGTAAVARLFNISMASVSSWKKKGIPAARMMYLEVKYKKILKKFKEEENNDK